MSSSPAKAIADLIEGVTEKWAKQRKAEERDRSARARRADRLIRRERPRSLKDTAASVMEQAYMAASANGTLPANPRQVMYCARPKILAITGRGNLDSQYFTQTLLVDYVKEHPEECVGWDVIWDDRGHFVEPHTGRRIGLGTIAIRRYIARYASPILCEAGYAGASVATYGPVGRYGALLYIEKEGFLPILELNAMASDQFIAFVDSKLTEAGIAKVVPPNARLDEASRLFARSKRVKAVVEEAIAALAGAEFGVPDDLGDQVRAYLAEHPDEPWEHAVRHAAADFDAESEK
jgi:hypothetical protein